jgi:hypothetical protein
MDRNQALGQAIMEFVSEMRHTAGQDQEFKSLRARQIATKQNKTANPSLERCFAMDKLMSYHWPLIWTKVAQPRGTSRTEFV